MSIKIHVLHCGQVGLDRSFPFKESTLNPLAFTGLFRSAKKRVWLPVSAYLIEHPKGLVLIDTGWHTDMRTDPKRHLGRIHYQVSKGTLPAGQAIHEQLQARGYKPSDIDLLILSHLHTDHAGGLQFVKAAKRIMVSDLEWKETIEKPSRYLPSLWDDVPIEQYQFSYTGIGPEGLSYDLFGDGSLVFVHTPGHTMGLASTIVSHGDKAVLLASDVGFARRSWEHMHLPGVHVDRYKVETSLQWIRSESLKPEYIDILANHDPNVEPQTICL